MESNSGLGPWRRSADGMSLVHEGHPNNDWVDLRRCTSSAEVPVCPLHRPPQHRRAAV